MLDQRKRIIEFAMSQVGICEDPKGSNKQKYGAYLDERPWYLRKNSSGKEYIHKVNGFNWCTSFVDASYIMTFSLQKAREMLYRPVMNDYGSVVKYAFNYFKAAGEGFTKDQYTPQPGDVIYFQNSEGLSHTGIVIDVLNGKVRTVEGNTSSEGKTSWYVAQKVYDLKSSYIYGYGVPNYSEEGKEMKFTDLRELKYIKGNVMKGDAVRMVQSVVKCDVDSSFGPATDKAVRSFQQDEKITVDGIVGPVTWERIWRKAE